MKNYFIILLLMMCISKGSTIDISDIAFYDISEDGINKPTIYRIVNGDTLVRVIVRSSNVLAKSSLQDIGLTIRSTTQGPEYTYRTGEISIKNIEMLKSVCEVELASKCYLSLDASDGVVRATTGRNAAGVDGTDVIIGIVDTGLDLRNPDFRNSDGSTRVIAFWDQTTNNKNPTGYDYGTEYTETEINDCLLNNNCPTYGLSEDPNGHGTHVAGIAAGNGNNNDPNAANSYIGMAPNADLVIVKTNFGTDAVIDGIQYIADIALGKNKKWVANLSLGRKYGPRNGTSKFEEDINTFDNLYGSPGIVVNSAGNTGYIGTNNEVVNHYDRHKVKKDHVRNTGNATYQFSTEGTDVSITKDKIKFLGFYYPSSGYSLKLKTPNDAKLLMTDGSWSSYTLYEYFDQYPVQPGEGIGLITQDGYISIDNNSQNDAFPNSGFNYIYIVLKDKQDSNNNWHHIVDGEWEIELADASDTEPWDLYILEYSKSVEPSSDAICFVTNDYDYDNNYNVTEPGNAPDIITVGSMNSKNQWKVDYNNNTYTIPDYDESSLFYKSGYGIKEKSFFTSEGPTRYNPNVSSEVTKPEIYAPGAWIASSSSSKTTTYQWWQKEKDQGGDYIYNRGTSISAPHVTGAVALLLQQGTYTDVKARLISTANEDDGYKRLHIWDALCKDNPDCRSNPGCPDCPSDVDKVNQNISKELKVEKSFGNIVLSVYYYIFILLGTLLLGVIVLKTRNNSIKRGEK